MAEKNATDGSSASNQLQLEPYFPFTTGIHTYRTYSSLTSATKSRKTLFFSNLAKRKIEVKDTKKTEKTDTKICLSEEDRTASISVNSNGSPFLFNQEHNMCNDSQFTFVQWWSTMLVCFDQWCKEKAEHPKCKKLASKHSFPNCQTAYFTGEEVTDWFMWYIAEYPYRNSGTNSIFKRENLAALASSLYKQNEFIEVDPKKSTQWWINSYIVKLNFMRNSDNLNNEEGFIDSKYRIYYRLC